jgi:hypothetical protein
MRLTLVTLSLAALGTAVPAHAERCEDGPARGAREGRTVPAPEALVSIDVDGHAQKVWPYTSADLTDRPSDPLNLVFAGEADPRQIRAALFALDGNRTAIGLPDVFPFNCTWSDAIGRQQAAWAEAEGWQGSAVQLQCGAYDTLRVHLRMFRQGRFTLANAHFEVLIPGTTDHEVLSWEFSQRLVAADLVRTGLLGAAPVPTGVITPAPFYRTIRPEVFGGVPAALRAVLGLPTTPQTTPVPIPNDGVASVFSLARAADVEPGEAERVFVHLFQQTIPKPFCSTGPLDYLRVEGPIDMAHRVEVDPDGEYRARFDAQGTLQVTPVDPRTGAATGPAYEARIRERHRSALGRRQNRAEHDVRQYLLADPLQAFFEDLRVGSRDVFTRMEDCGS